MCKKILIIVVSVILILTFSGSIIAKGILSAKIELKDGSVITGEIEKLIISIKTKDGVKEVGIEDIVFLQMNIISSSPETTIGGSVWRLESPWYIITGKTSPRGWREFRGIIEKSIGERGGLLGGYSGHSLVEQAERHLKYIKQSNIIFLILPKAKEFKALQELWKKYPELFPLSCDKLNELSSDISPLIYLAYDIQAEKLRGVVVADKVDISLAKLLAEEELPLNTPLQYKDGQLEEIKEK
ncbi:unnamed protein product [marine sediment metagenome]|uniref:Uncharacterized protein n=1 Tax=marine sediment metagenome TaxID=412755 RepID=X1E0E3_9ZZZZ